MLAPFFIMKLVKIDNYKLAVEPELLLLKPFKTLYDKDTSADKEAFFDFLTVVYYAYDPRSDYMYIIDDDSRIEEVLHTNGLKKMKMTSLHEECIALYKKLTMTTATALLDSTRMAIKAVQDELVSTRETLSDLDSKDKITALKSLTSTLSILPDLVKKVIETEKVVTQEINETSRKRGGDKGSSVYEDNDY